MTTSVGMNLLNLENKQRQQPKIAHEQGAGSQCVKCGPKCTGFDLHYWRKVCRNCRCGKENHLVVEATAGNDDPSDVRAGRLFVAPSPTPLTSTGFDWTPSAEDERLAAEWMRQLTDGAERKRALDRQLPAHDLDPARCTSLSTNKERQQLEDYVSNVKDNVVGRGILKLPPPPPHLTKILQDKVDLLHLEQPNQKKSSKKSVHFENLTAKPYATPAPATLPKPQTPSTPPTPPTPPPPPPPPASASPYSDADADFLPPPPPPELLVPLNDVEMRDAALDATPRRRTAHDGLFDFLDDLLDDNQRKKSPPGRLKSPFLSDAGVDPPPPMKSAPKPPRVSPAANAFKPSGQNPVKPASPPKRRGPVLVTDLDAVLRASASAPRRPPTPPTPPPPPPLVPPPELYEVKILDEPVPEVVQVISDVVAPPDLRKVKLVDEPVPEVVQVEQLWKCDKCGQDVQAGQVAIFAERAGSDKCWHPQCFCCTVCNEMLADLIYFFVDEQLFCGRHYAERVKIPRCKACDELIFAGEYTSAEDAAWHTDHFCCWLCDAPLAGRQYTPIDGQPHCLDCYQRKYGKDCYECKGPIRADETRVSHGDEMHWHATAQCFHCAACRDPLLNRRFLLKKQRVYCPRCVTATIVRECHR